MGSRVPAADRAAGGGGQGPASGRGGGTAARPPAACGANTGPRRRYALIPNRFEKPAVEFRLDPGEHCSHLRVAASDTVRFSGHQGIYATYLPDLSAPRYGTFPVPEHCRPTAPGHDPRPDRGRWMIQALQTMRDVAEVTATTLMAQVGGFSRFAPPRQWMAYAGLVPSEHSTGGTRRQGGNGSAAACRPWRTGSMAGGGASSPGPVPPGGARRPGRPRGRRRVPRRPRRRCRCLRPRGRRKDGPAEGPVRVAGTARPRHSQASPGRTPWGIAWPARKLACVAKNGSLHPRCEGSLRRRRRRGPRPACPRRQGAAAGDSP
jgi:hypothetical protein